MSLIKESENYIINIVKNLGYDINEIKINKSSKPELGQFQLNFVMQLAKKYNMNPIELANEVIKKLDDRFINVNIAGPGFINITFSTEYTLNYLNKCIDNFEMFIDKEVEKTIIIDYGGANAAKSLHVGHMRSANIGEALKRLAKIFGNNVIGDVHLGEIGRQAGMLISQLMVEQPEIFKQENIKLNLTAKDLGRMYPVANNIAKSDEKRMEQVRNITAEIDKGNKLYTNIWKQMVDISSIEIKKVYKNLNCNFDLWEGELDAFNYIPQALNYLKPYLYTSDGALVMDVKLDTDKKEMPPLIVIKTDGATIYATRELGTIYSRITRFNPDEIWYVVDQRQGLYFEQVFRACYKSNLVKETTKLKHYGFGTINGIDGKPFKTRDGNVMELSSLIDMVKEEIINKIKPEIKGKEREEIANTLTIATIKYTDLLPFRQTDYIFDPVKFSSFEGKTGPYILYTNVRIKSLLNKILDKNYQISNITNNDLFDIYTKLLELPYILKYAYNDATLSYIAEYLYELSSLYNKFYSNNNILNEKNNKIKETYIAVSKLVYNVLNNLLNILAIDTVEKM